jgi:cytochrome P450 family 3 subfamily A
MALVKQYGKVIGYFDGLVPNLWITDVDMIKAMYVKDFDHFVDRRVRRKKIPFLKIC